MLRSAGDDFPIDLTDSWMIGDKRLDVETGFNAGINTAMVRTGYGRDHSVQMDRRPDIIADDLLQAVEQILEFKKSVIPVTA